MENVEYSPYVEHREEERPTRLILPHAHPPQQRSLPLQTIRNPQADHRPFRPALPIYKPVKHIHQTAALYTASSMGGARAYFKEFVNSPDHVYLTSRPNGQHPFAVQMLPQNYSFRPLGAFQPPFQDPHDHVKIKTEESAAVLPMPAVLPGSVDASQYESIPYSEWLQASTEYDCLSPSPLEAHADSPATPGGWEPDHNMAREAFAIMSAEPVACNNHFWIGQPQMQPAHILPPNHGLPSPAQASSFSSSSASEESEPHALPEQPRIYTAAPHDLSLATTTACSSSEDGNETATQSSEPEDHDPDSETDGEVDAQRKEQDDFLIRMREEGYKYSEIKRRGGFKEAESTLRGRYRALTKGKMERLRSPKWEERDVVLLRQAVKRFTNGNVNKLKTRHGGKKVPWKKIGEWIKDHGGSYLFAPATCAKKWEHVKRMAPAA